MPSNKETPMLVPPPPAFPPPPGVAWPTCFCQGQMAVGQTHWYHFGVGAPPIFSLFQWGFGCSLGVRDFDPWPNKASMVWGPRSSGGPRPANKLLHTYPPPYIFFHLPSSTLICFHHFSTFLSVHLIRFFIIIFPFFLQSFSPFSSPHSFHQLPSKMSFPQSPHLIHFKKINFAKYIAKNICHQKNIRTV